jgi:hypothetical protein
LKRVLARARTRLDMRYRAYNVHHSVSLSGRPHPSIAQLLPARKKKVSQTIEITDQGASITTYNAEDRLLFPQDMVKSLLWRDALAMTDIPPGLAWRMEPGGLGSVRAWPNHSRPSPPAPDGSAGLDLCALARRSLCFRCRARGSTADFGRDRPALLFPTRLRHRTVAEPFH